MKQSITKRSRIDRIIRLWSIAALCVLLVSCFEAPEPPFRLGTNVWPGYEPLYLARSLGHYEDANIELVEYLSASEVIRAIRNDSIEAAAVTLDEALLLLDHGVPIAVVLVTDFSNGGDAILARPPIASIDDLKNKRVGVEGTALGAFFLARALEVHSTPVELIDLVQLEVSEHADAYLQDAVDAVVTFEPVRSKLLLAGAKEIFSSREIPGEIVDVIVVNHDYLSAHPDKITEMLQGWFAALDYLKTHPQDAAAQISSRLGLDSNEALQSYDGLTLPTLAENKVLLGGSSPTLSQTIERLQRVLVDKKLISDDVALDGFLNPSTLP